MNGCITTTKQSTTKPCAYLLGYTVLSLVFVWPMTWAPSQYPKRRLFVRSREVSKPRDWYFKLSHRFEIWQAHRQQCCRSACQISERSDNPKCKSQGFETLRDLTERRLFGYWDGALVLNGCFCFFLPYFMKCSTLRVRYIVTIVRRRWTGTHLKRNTFDIISSFINIKLLSLHSINILHLICKNI